MIINPLRDPDVKAICFLKKDGDLKNCLYYTLKALTIVIKGRPHLTSLDQVRRIELGNRKLLGPIVAGGIIFPLSSLAMAGNFGDYFYMMVLMMLGIFLLIYGFSGSPAITIETSGGVHHYFISKTGRNIEQFIEYYNKRKYLND